MNRVDLLVNYNLTRHVDNKLHKLAQIVGIASTTSESVLLESLLPLLVGYFDAAILDTIKEYVYARPFEIHDLMINRLEIGQLKLDMKELALFEFDEYLIKRFVSEIENESIKDKLTRLRGVCKINVDLDSMRWELIREIIARRNCLIHNDLIANEAYFRQAGSAAEKNSQGKRLAVSLQYLSEAINSIIQFLEIIKKCLTDAYWQNTNIGAVKNLWEYIFEDHYPLQFDNCWHTLDDNIIYKGPTIAELQEMVSPRTVCLFSAWMSFFNGHAYRDLKYFSDIFYNNEQDRKIYTSKLIYLARCFEYIDFQTFKIKMYKK